MTQHVTIPTAFRECVDAEITRYPLGAVSIIPSQGGKVWMRATDARVLAIREADGHVDKPELISAGMLEDRKSTKRLSSRRKLEHDGTGWVDAERYAKPVDGKFPKAEQVIPEATEKMLVVNIDAKRLLDLANAINDESPAVVLFIGTEPYDGEYVDTAPIAVLGSNGFGILARLAASEKENSQSAERFNDLRKRHAEAVAALEPKPAKKPRKAKVSK